MMETQRSCLRFLIAVMFLSCFFAMFYVYHSPTMNGLQYPALHCPDACINHTKIINNICVGNITRVNDQFKETEPKPTSPSQTETLLLIWIRPFGQKVALESCSQFQIEGCQLTDDRNLFSEAHGVLFHHGDINEDLSNMPTLPRPYFQKWVWMNMESPSNSALKPRLNDLFNLTTSYRRDSDITVPYGQTSVRSVEEDRTYQIPQKEKFICWIVTNWNPDYERSKYYEKLKEYVSVETYGESFSRYVSDEDYPKLVSSCKFYLSFENSIHEDYVTEKVYNPMKLGTVPVVLGPPRKNYERFIPAEAFIHVDDFKTAEALAAHLTVLHQNTDMYEKYFRWRERYTVRGTWFGLEHACRSCDHIRRNRNYRTVNDLNTWYWG